MNVQEMSAMELRQHHKEELRAQMAANEERQKREHAEYLLEGEKTRQKLQAEKDFIEVSNPILMCLCDSNLPSVALLQNLKGILLS